ncbi:MAG: ATP-dependent helicase HrpB [Gemmatimonadetes bacterium]|nr:ATP-dependent helicase HrpB [Gemmatimonadota bacterium]
MAPLASSPERSDLPIEAAVPALRHALGSGRSAVLQAPPGAGKTTRVPLALLAESWMHGRRMVMLEPRRLAARAAAARMAAVLGEPVGRTVGYRVRHDKRVGRETRIEVVTEGILTRMLQSDPGLEGIGLLVFDEFHERSVHADLGLALALQARALLRDDLRILVMSATLDGAAVSGLLEAGAGAPILSSEGRSYPVDTRYLARPVEGWIEPAVARSVRSALAENAGDVLVFLPGAGEIRRVEEYLRGGDLPMGVEIHPLHGSLPQDAQERAIAPRSRGRKVVLSTAIAETSLTIEGITVVVDSGLMRVPRFSPRIGMSRLETVAVSRASADQRRGRAGRLGPGVCHRLWTEQQQAELLAHGTPEILAADLAPLALELAAWGADDPEQLAWLDPPAPAAYAQARELLGELGALAGGRITPHGRRMAGLGMHPRLAHMALRAQELGLGALACEIAALLGERDLLRADGPVQDVDLRLRVEALRDARAGGPAGFTVDRAAAERARGEARQLRDRLAMPAGESDPDGAGVLLSLAYPDRIAQQREPGSTRYLLRNGAGATLRDRQALSREPYLAIAEIEGQARDARIVLAAPLSLDELEVTFADQMEVIEQIAWDGASGSVRATRRALLGALVIREGTIPDPDPARVRRAVAEAVTREGLEILPWSTQARQLQQRVLFLRSLDERWPDLSDTALSRSSESWLEPHLTGIRRRTELDRLDLVSILSGLLPWELRASIDELAPTHLLVPSGSSIPIDYSVPGAPSVAVRLQEMFGLGETPRLAGVPLTVHFLSPAHRAVQVTRDLASFWREGYFEVRKNLRARYPKHSWPDDPLRAEPTSRAKRR